MKPHFVYSEFDRPSFSYSRFELRVVILVEGTDCILRLFRRLSHVEFLFLRFSNKRSIATVVILFVIFN